MAATETAVQQRAPGRSAANRAPNPSGLYDVLELILDKGLVIDVYVRVSLVGIELLTIDARIVIASVDTYLRFAEAVNRLDLAASSETTTLPDLVDDLGHKGAKGKSRGLLEGAKEAIVGTDDDKDEGKKKTTARRTRQKTRSRSSSKDED